MSSEQNKTAGDEHEVVQAPAVAPAAAETQVGSRGIGIDRRVRSTELFFVRNHGSAF